MSPLVVNIPELVIIFNKLNFTAASQGKDYPRVAHIANDTNEFPGYTCMPH